MYFFLLPIFFVLILIFFLWHGLALNPSVIPSPLIGKPLPLDHGPKLNNRRLDRKHFLGHWSLLNVWASWCSACAQEHPTLIQLSKRVNIILYGLNYRDDIGLAKDWLLREGNPYRWVMYDPDGKFAMDLGVYGVPESFLIDPEGVIRYKQVGPISDVILNQQILPLIHDTN